MAHTPLSLTPTVYSLTQPLTHTLNGHLLNTNSTPVTVPVTGGTTPDKVRLLPAGLYLRVNDRQIITQE